ncbi:hypothetical protein SLS61_000587 [Didymella pomorum]
MAYSWVTFLAALTVHVCDPLIRRSPWSDKNKTAIVYLVIGFLGLATYVFTAIFVYVSEKDLEHHVTGAKNNRTPGAYINASGTPPVLPPIGRASANSKASVSFEVFSEDGFVEVDIERQAVTQTSKSAQSDAPKNRKKPRMILFN